jgi:hypothetical protein
MELSAPHLANRAGRIAVRVIVGLVLVLIGLGWWAFTNPPEVTPAGSKSWSKGVYAGTASLNQSAALQVDKEGAYLVWVDEANRLHYVTVDGLGTINSDKFLAIATLFPRSPQLILDPDHQLHLAWLDGQGSQQLYYARLDRSGNMLLQPVTISREDENISAFDMVLNDRGELEIFWSRDEGLVHATLDHQGQPLQPPTLLWPAGDRPSVQVDHGGLIHLVFVERYGSLNLRVRYATFEPATKTLSRPIEVLDIFRRGGQILEGPAIGLDNENVYLFWSLADSRDVTSLASYASFPLADPRPAAPVALNITNGDYPGGLWPLDRQGNQMITTLSSQVYARGEWEFQILTGVFADGAYQGHQLVSASRSPSLKPALAADKAGNLHAVWLDAGRFQAYKVVYASNMSGVREALAGVTFYEFIDNLFGIVLSLFFVAGVLPFLIVWGIVPLVIVLVYFFATGQDELAEQRSWWVLGLACLVQVLIMMFLSPDNVYLSTFWRFSLPIFLAVPALLVLYFVTVRWKMRSLFVAFILFVFIHGLLRLFVFAFIVVGPT